MKILFTGDFCPFDGYDISFAPELVRLFRDCDYSFTNLECPLTNEVSCIDKGGGVSLKASPSRIGLLKQLGVSGVTLANNHLKDYGDRGVLETLDVCKDNDIMVVGAGKNLAESRKPLILCKNGLRVGILNVAEREFSIAGDSCPGAAPFDLINLMRDLSALRHEVDRIIIVIHGGLEAVVYPSPESVRVLRFLAEQDKVVAIVRHHPHRVQGIEIWNGTHICYSLGNFIFPWYEKLSPLWYKGLAVEISVEREFCELNYHEISVSKDEKSILAYAESGITELPTLDEKFLSEFWNAKFEERKNTYLGILLTPWHFLQRIYLRLGVLRFVSRTKMRVIENIIRCDAHAEMVKMALKMTNIKK